MYRDSIQERMRPKVPNKLAERIETVYEQAGYSTTSEFVRDAIRRRVEEIEQTSKPLSNQEFDFQYAMKNNAAELMRDEFPILHVRPEGSRVRNVADEGQKLVLSVDQKEITKDAIRSGLNELSQVSAAGLTRDDPWNRKTEDDGWIQIHFEADELQRMEIDAVVAEIFETLEQTIATADGWSNPHNELENTVKRYTTN